MINGKFLSTNTGHIYGNIMHIRMDKNKFIEVDNTKDLNLFELFKLGKLENIKSELVQLAFYGAIENNFIETAKEIPNLDDFSIISDPGNTAKLIDDKFIDENALKGDFENSYEIKSPKLTYLIRLNSNNINAKAPYFKLQNIELPLCKECLYNIIPLLQDNEKTKIKNN